MADRKIESMSGLQYLKSRFICQYYSCWKGVKYFLEKGRINTMISFFLFFFFALSCRDLRNCHFDYSAANLDICVRHLCKKMDTLNINTKDKFKQSRLIYLASLISIKMLWKEKQELGKVKLRQSSKVINVCLSVPWTLALRHYCSNLTMARDLNWPNWILWVQAWTLSLPLT